MLHWHNLVYLPLIAILPVCLMAEDTGAAILHSSGVVLLNKNRAPSTTALLAGDLVETQEGAVARIELTGSAADVNAETVVRFDPDEIILDHGSLSVNTSRGLRVRVGCVMVTPVGVEWTQYEVRDLNGRVTVSAIKDDVYVESRATNGPQVKESARSDRTIVREGEQKTREEKCGGSTPEQSTPIAAKGAILNSPYVQGAGAGVIVGVACWLFCFPPESISPDHP